MFSRKVKARHVDSKMMSPAPGITILKTILKPTSLILLFSRGNFMQNLALVAARLIWKDPLDYLANRLSFVKVKSVGKTQVCRVIWAGFTVSRWTAGISRLLFLPTNSFNSPGFSFSFLQIKISPPQDLRSFERLR